MISVVAGLALQWPSLAPLLMASATAGMRLHLFGAMAMFLGVMLVVCSRDLTHRGVLVAWEGMLRLGGFAIMAGYGIFAGGGMQLISAGLFDLAVGVAYLILLPRALVTSLVALLLDRRQ